MSYYTKADKLKEVRAYCKAQGVTFKKSNHYINGVQAWHIAERKTGAVLVQHLTIDSAFDAIENGALIW